MTDLKCFECGCTMPPDSNKCPNCGHKYSEATVKVPSKNNSNGITVGRIGYSIKCELHGRIHITASVASAPTRCPFC
jgi:hypothetical protein